MYKIKKLLITAIVGLSIGVLTIPGNLPNPGTEPTENTEETEPTTSPDISLLSDDPLIE